jgi:pimeloyl-ACP methyl ester carboxylesterase
MTPDQIVAFVLALTAPAPEAPLFPVIAAGGADARYPVTAAACPRPLAPFEIEGTTVACGKVNVPEDHANPDGRRIDLTVMVFKSRSLAPAPDAVVHLHGGPGGGIINEVSLTSRFFEHLRTRRDVVAFDQRGVDASGSAESRCFATMAADPQAIVDATRGLGDRQALTREMTRACLDEIRASGADISKINTQQNAMDVGAVMHALGYPAYNIYGLSYGTKLGQEVMRTAPEGVRSVVLDSVAPVSAAIYDTLALPYAEAIQHVFDYCTADPKCATAYPDLRNRFWAVQARLETDPIETPEGTIGMQSLIDLFDDKNNWRNQMQGSSGYIPKMVAELEAGDPTTFLALKANRLPLHPTPDSVLAGSAGSMPTPGASPRPRSASRRWAGSTSWPSRTRSNGWRPTGARRRAASASSRRSRRNWPRRRRRCPRSPPARPSRPTTSRCGQGTRPATASCGCFPPTSPERAATASRPFST